MSNMKRRMLQAQIAEQKAAGKSTELLEAELEYVDIEEAAMKARANKQKL
jgi:hypothetical protein